MKRILMLIVLIVFSAHFSWAQVWKKTVEDFGIDLEYHLSKIDESFKNGDGYRYRKSVKSDIFKSIEIELSSNMKMVRIHLDLKNKPVQNFEHKVKSLLSNNYVDYRSSVNSLLKNSVFYYQDLEKAQFNLSHFEPGIRGVLLFAEKEIEVVSEFDEFSKKQVFKIRKGHSSLYDQDGLEIIINFHGVVTKETRFIAMNVVVSDYSWSFIEKVQFLIDDGTVFESDLKVNSEVFLNSTYESGTCLLPSNVVNNILDGGKTKIRVIGKYKHDIETNPIMENYVKILANELYQKGNSPT